MYGLKINETYYIGEEIQDHYELNQCEYIWHTGNVISQEQLKQRSYSDVMDVLYEGGFNKCVTRDEVLRHMIRKIRLISRYKLSILNNSIAVHGESLYIVRNYLRELKSIIKQSDFILSQVDKKI